MPHPLLVETVVLDGMWRVPERSRRAGSALPDLVDRSAVPTAAHTETTQALGICFTVDCQIVLLTWNGTDWSLPGGSLEPGETLEEALAREVDEEACARVVSSRYIGSQLVEELDDERPPHYQTRFWARVELRIFRAEHEMTGRRLVAPNEFRGVLFWGAEPAAGLILERGLAIERSERRA